MSATTHGTKADRIRSLEAELSKARAERDNLDAALDSVCRDVLVSLAGYVGTPAEGYRKAGISWIGAHIRGAREKGRAAEAEVARLRETIATIGGKP